MTIAVSIERELLKLRDLYLSYAGTYNLDHKLHKALSELNVGDQLLLQEKYEKGVLYDQARGLPVGQLSKVVSQKWLHSSDTSIPGIVVAMLKWRNKDSDEAYQSRHKCHEWEVPMVELQALK